MSKTPDMLALLATAELTRDQLSWLTGDQLSWLTGDQLRGLTRDQLRGLTRDQLRGLTREDVPKVENLYSKMLADIQQEKRLLDQRSFGPDSGPQNVCDTPMCIAGHTVNLAGSDGYALKKRVGFACAALLIHRASRPDTGAPRYDNYPNAWALAYIEKRAEEEKAAAA